jgi:hypothetical protein
MEEPKQRGFTEATGANLYNNIGGTGKLIKDLLRFSPSQFTNKEGELTKIIEKAVNKAASVKLKYLN